MFYSQTFLARKGPLGNVWCAAHLQHRLKKSHYTSTDISSTVDRIMFPEVPIALRMSGHLLLGVVWIYSKKVDYLFQDCTVVLVGLSKAFTTIEVNLPENATTATFDSVTLPPTLNLDAFDMSDYLDPEGSPDSHLKSYEEITMTDQISPYITICIDEDDNIIPPVPDQDPNSEARPMEDICPPTPVNGDLPSQVTGERTQTVVNNKTGSGASNQTDVLMDTMDFQDPGPSNQPEDLMDTGDFRDPAPSNQTEVLMDTGDFRDPGPSNQTEVPTETLNQRLSRENSPPEIEVMRDAAYDLGSENFPLSSDRRDDATEPNRSLDEVLNKKDFLSPIMEDVLPSLGESLPFQQHSKAPTSAASQDVPDIFDTHGSFGNISPQFAIHSTPPVQQPQPGPPSVQQPRPRRRRRMQFDEATVLTNRFMKRALKDSSDLIRKKRMRSSSRVAIWRLNNSLRKEQIFYEPLITGSCADLCNLFKEYITTKPHLTTEQGVTSEHRVATSPGPETEAIPEPRLASSPAPTTEPISEPMVAQSPVPGHESSMENECHRQDLGRDGNNVVPEIDMGIERLRDNGGHDGNDILSEILSSPARPMPSPGRFMPSSLRRDDFTPMPSSLGSETVSQEGTSTATGVLHTLDFSASPATYQFGEQNTGLSDIPESMNTTENDDLGKILEADDTPVGSLGIRDIDSLPVRTRGVAKYLKEHSPIIPLSEESSGDISLNRILQGKTRKLCARMFFETMDIVWKITARTFYYLWLLGIWFLFWKTSSVPIWWLGPEICASASNFIFKQDSHLMTVVYFCFEELCTY